MDSYLNKLVAFLEAASSLVSAQLLDRFVVHLLVAMTTTVIFGGCYTFRAYEVETITVFDENWSISFTPLIWRKSLDERFEVSITEDFESDVFVLAVEFQPDSAFDNVCIRIDSAVFYLYFDPLESKFATSRGDWHLPIERADKVDDACSGTRATNPVEFPNPNLYYSTVGVEVFISLVDSHTGAVVSSIPCEIEGMFLNSKRQIAWPGR